MQIKLSDIKLLKSKPAFWGGLFLIFIVFVLLIILIVSLMGARQTAKMIIDAEETKTVAAIDWNNEEIRALLKTKCWFESQLALSKDDSMSLGINLRDSIIQIQLDGLPLIQSRILYIRPKSFLSEIDAAFYSKLFGQPAKIISGKSNYPKRPIKKMKVVEGADAELITDNIVKSKRFYWEFVSDNNIRIVINGCKISDDSIEKKPSFFSDMIKFRLKSKSKNPEKQIYHPTLFLWMNDNDAKAIYRALSEKSRLSIRN